MALTRTAKAAEHLAGYGSAPTQITDVPLTAGALVVVKVAWSNDTGTGTVVPSASGLTLTQAVVSTDVANHTAAGIWTAEVPSSADYDFTFTPAAGVWWHGAEIVEFSDADGTGATGSYAVSPLVTAGPASLTLGASPASDSYVEAVLAVDNDGSPTSVTPGSGWTESADETSATGTLQGQYRTGSTSTNVAWADVNAAAVTVYSSAGAAVEIVAASGGGAQDISLPAIAATSTLAAPTVTRGAVALTLATIAAASTLAAPTVTPPAQSLALPAITAASTLAAPTVTRGAVAVSLPAIASTATLAAPTVTSGATSLSLPTIASSATLAAPTITVGDVTVELPAITSAAAPYPPVVAPAGTALALPHITSTAELDPPVVTVAPVTVGLPTIAAGSVLHPPTVAGDHAVTLPHIDSTAILRAMAVGGAQVVAPPDRIITVGAEDRTVVVVEESRTVTVAAEDRTITVGVT